VATPLELEDQGWEALQGDEPRAFYDGVLDDHAVFVLPGMALDRAQTLASWEEIPPWDDVRRSTTTVVDLAPGVTLLTYAAEAVRAGQAPYRARFTSVYVRSGTSTWRLAFHQQTPDPG
jgi:hypothetical protein